MERNPMSYDENFPALCASFGGGGALLTVCAPDGTGNPMTIGWGTVGRIWARPIFTVLVRGSRYSFELIEGAKVFTVSVPAPGELTKALQYCGTRSGRDGDKAAACGITLTAGVLEGARVVEEAAFFYECEIVHKNDVAPIELDPAITDQYYGQGDYHRIYYGVIKEAYGRKLG